MIGDPGVAHRVDVEESHRRDEHAAEHQGAGKRPAPNPGSQGPQRCEQCERRYGRQPLHEAVRIDGETRVDKRQIDGPQQLPEVQPDHPSGKHDAAWQRQRPLGTGRPDHGPLQFRGVQRERRSDQEERRQRPDVDPPDAAVLPPRDHQQHRRQQARRRLGEQREREGREGRDVDRTGPSPPRRRLAAAAGLAPLALGEAGIAVGQKREHRGQRQHHRQRVLALGHPRNRLDAHRVKRKQRGRRPRPGKPEAAQQRGEQQRRRRMKQHVHEVEAERMQPPQLLLQPEGGEDERVVLLVGLRLGPDELEGIRPVEHPVLGQVGVVVPHEAGPECRQVRRHHRQHDHHRHQDIAPLSHPERVAKHGAAFGGLAGVHGATFPSVIARASPRHSPARWRDDCAEGVVEIDPGRRIARVELKRFTDLRDPLRDPTQPEEGGAARAASKQQRGYTRRCHREAP